MPYPHHTPGTIELQPETMVPGCYVQRGGEGAPAGSLEAGTQFAAQTIATFHDTSLGFAGRFAGFDSRRCGCGSEFTVETRCQPVGDIVVARQLAVKNRKFLRVYPGVAAHYGFCPFLQSGDGIAAQACEQ